MAWGGDGQEASFGVAAVDGVDKAVVDGVNRALGDGYAQKRLGEPGPQRREDRLAAQGGGVGAANVDGGVDALRAGGVVDVGVCQENRFDLSTSYL